MYAILYNTCFSLSDLPHSVWQSLCPSMSLQMAHFHSFLFLAGVRRIKSQRDPNFELNSQHLIGVPLVWFCGTKLEPSPLWMAWLSDTLNREGRWTIQTQEHRHQGSIYSCRNKRTSLAMTKLPRMESTNACPHLPPSQTWGVSFSLSTSAERKQID